MRLRGPGSSAPPAEVKRGRAATPRVADAPSLSRLPPLVGATPSGVTLGHPSSSGAAARPTRRLELERALPIPGADAVPTAAQGLDELMASVWARRRDLSLQPKHTMIYRLSGLEVPDESAVALPPFLSEIRDLVRKLPPSVDAGATGLGATRAELLPGLEAALAGTLPARQLGQIEHGRLRFHRKDWDPALPAQRTFIDTQPDAALGWVRRLVEEVLAKPETYPGVAMVDIAGPGIACRADDVTVITTDPVGRERLHEFIAEELKRRPGSLDPAIIPGSEGVLPGVSWGEEPCPDRYPGRSFRSVRARVVFNALQEVLAEGGSEADFRARVKSSLRIAGIHPEQPHLNLPSAPEPGLAPLTVGTEPKPGIYACEVDAFGEKATVRIELGPEVAARLKKQKRMVFLPERGQVGFTGIDRTRDPAARVIEETYSITHAADQRFKLERGELPPALVAFDEKTQAFYVPETVRLVPTEHPTRIFDVEPVGRAVEQTRPLEPLLPLTRRFVRSETQPEVRAAAASKIESYLSDPTAQVVSAVPLEEGVNGKAIVRLDNGAVAVWKPSSAEYPELMRSNLGPDHFARREAFAYRMSKLMGHLGRVPPAIYRELGGERGALIALIQQSEAGVFSPRLPELVSRPERPEYREIALLDHVIGALDRHHGNLLFVGDTVLAIDHGLCMPRRNGPQGAHQFLLDAEFRLEASDRQRLEALLGAWPEVLASGEELGIHPDALVRMRERVESLLERGQVDHAWRR